MLLHVCDRLTLCLALLSDGALCLMIWMHTATKCFLLSCVCGRV